MDKQLLLLLFAAAISSPAQATGGFTCRTAGAKPIVVTIGFGHAPGAPLLTDVTRLVDKGRNVPVTVPQWWLDQSELRILLSSPDAMTREAIVKTRRKGALYEGSLWRHGKRHWVRCGES
jgi:hypothetical protein